MGEPSKLKLLTPARGNRGRLVADPSSTHPMRTRNRHAPSLGSTSPHADGEQRSGLGDQQGSRDQSPLVTAHKESTNRVARSQEGGGQGQAQRAEIADERPADEQAAGRTFVAAFDGSRGEDEGANDDEGRGETRSRSLDRSSTPLSSLDGRALVTLDFGSSSIQITSGEMTSLREPRISWEVFWFDALEGINASLSATLPTNVALLKNAKVPMDSLEYGFAARTNHQETPHKWALYDRLKFPSMMESWQDSLPDEVFDKAQEQHEHARSTGTDLESLAWKFLKHALQPVLDRLKPLPVALFYNVNDLWGPRAVIQLQEKFRSHFKALELQPINECHASLLACVRAVPQELVSGIHVVADAGHATLDVGTARVSRDGHVTVTSWQSYPYGGCCVNDAVEHAFRMYSNDEAFVSSASRLAENYKWSITHDRKPSCPPEFFLPEEEQRSDVSQESYSRKRTQQWETLFVEPLLKASIRLDELRVNAILREVAQYEGIAGSVYLHMAGGGSNRKAYQVAMIKQCPQYAKLLRPFQGSAQSAVTLGLQEAASHPEKLKIARAPMSIWIRSDDPMPASRSATPPGMVRVARLCRKGDRLTPDPSANDHCQTPIPYKLSLDQDKKVSGGDTCLEIDLSIFEVDEGPNDNREKLYQNKKKPSKTALRHRYCAQDRRLEEVTRRLEDLKMRDVNDTAHVYVWVSFDSMSVQLWAVYASDGRKVERLRTALEEVFNPYTGQLCDGWKSHEPPILVTSVKTIVRAALDNKRSNDVIAAAETNGNTAGSRNHQRKRKLSC